MIIQTGMRTDIPAFYSDWFVNRVKEGFVLVRNPYNPSNVTRFKLNPEVVDLIGFCTKNPKPMLGKTDILKSYGQYWFVTITPYEKEIEPKVPPKESVMESFKALSDIVGVDSMGWRYDPIYINEKYTVSRHISDFEGMCRTLSGYTKTCVISFIDLYNKVEKNFPEVRAVTKNERLSIGKAFAEIGRMYGITIKSCAEGTELAQFGVDCGGCMTIETYETALHKRLILPNRKSQRAECACFFGTDIGAYDSCGHMCRYCYANSNWDAVRKNMRLHDPNSPFLIGNIMPDDVIRESQQESYIDRQLTLF